MKKGWKMLIAVMALGVFMIGMFVSGIAAMALFRTRKAVDTTEITVGTAVTTTSVTSTYITKEKVIFDPFAITTRAETASETTTTEAATTVIADYSDADMLITNGYILPQYFVPDEGVCHSIGEALSKVPVTQREKSSVFSSRIIGKFYIRTDDEKLMLSIYSDHSADLCDAEDVISFDLSDEAFQTLYEAVMSFRENGNELFYYELPDIIIEEEGRKEYDVIWDGYLISSDPGNCETPCGDFSEGNVFLRDIAIYPSLLTATDEQTKRISDVFNSCEWERLPDDAKSSIDYCVEAFIDSNGEHMSLAYTGDGIFVFVKNGEVSKYSVKGGALGAMKDTLDSIRYYPDRMLASSTEYDYEQQIFTDHVWDSIEAFTPEEKEKLNSIAGPPLPDAE